MDSLIEATAAFHRQQARYHLDRLLIDWRKELWPDRSKDPIWIEEHEVRVRSKLSRLHSAHAAVADFFGATSLIP